MKNCEIIYQFRKNTRRGDPPCTEETCIGHASFHRKACGGQCGLGTRLAEKKTILEKIKTKLERPRMLPRMPLMEIVWLKEKWQGISRKFNLEGV